MRQVRQILFKTGAIAFLLFFSVLSVYAQTAIRLVIPIVSPACFNGIDDDGDGLVDYPDDPDCVDQDDESEHNLTAIFLVSAPTVTLGQLTTWNVTPFGGSTTYIYSGFCTRYPNIICGMTERRISSTVFSTHNIPPPIDISSSIPEADMSVEEGTEYTYNDSYHETRDPLPLDSAPERSLSTEPRPSIDISTLDTPDQKNDSNDTSVTQDGDVSYPIYTELAESSIVIFYSILFCFFLGCIFWQRKTIFHIFKKNKR